MLACSITCGYSVNLFRIGRLWKTSKFPQTLQKMLQNHRGSVMQSVIFASVSQNWLGPVPILYIVIRYPQQMVRMAFFWLLAYVSQICHQSSQARFSSPYCGEFWRLPLTDMLMVSIFVIFRLQFVPGHNDGLVVHAGPGDCFHWEMSHRPCRGHDHWGK